MVRRLAPCVNRLDVRDLYLVISATAHTRFAGELKEFYVRTEDELSIAEKVAKLPQVEIDPLFSGYTHNDYASLDFDWSFWRRPEQIAPPGTWDNWLILAGRGFGKTRTGAEWVRANMCGDTPLTGGR